MSPVVVAFGHRLVVAAPRRPRQHLLDRRKRPPNDAPEEAPDFGDGQRHEWDQLGDVSCPAD